jgi:hypothetical protein
MSEELEAAKRYRMHAEELRAIAGNNKMLPCQAALREIARDYEWMARTMESIHRTHKALSRRRGELVQRESPTRH